MSAYLRRLVDPGVGALLYPGSGGDIRFHGNRALVAESGAGYLRLWADWPTLQPDPAYAIDDPAGPGFPYLQALDDQIRTACEDGLRVILLAYRFPVWANGMEALAAQRNTDAEISHRPWDRMSPEAWARYQREGRDPARYSPGRRGLELHIPPEGFGPDSAWARFFAFLYDRYHLGRWWSGRYVHGFELQNEPNYQWWPQRAPSPTDDPFAPGEITAARAFAELMRRAQAIATRYGNTTRILAPSSADSERGGRIVTGFELFTPALLDALDALGYVPRDEEAWAHHNYLDMDGRQDDTRAQRLRALLRGRWRGYGAGQPDAPIVFITEGGVRLPVMRAWYPQEDPLQAQLVNWQQGWARHARDDGSGEGIAMLAQYTLRADPGFDCGLMEPWPSDVRRPSFAFWSSLPRVG